MITAHVALQGPSQTEKNEERETKEHHCIVAKFMTDGL